MFLSTQMHSLIYLKVGMPFGTTLKLPLNIKLGAMLRMEDLEKTNFDTSPLEFGSLRVSATM
jgi:hypothetical protein